MKATAKTSKPHDAFNSLFEEDGGMTGCQSVGDLPRNCKQVSNIRYKISDPQPCRDTLYEVLKKCIDEQSPNQS